MRKPVSQVLIINNEKLILMEFIKGLNTAEKSIENPSGLVFSGVTTAQQALHSIDQDGDIQPIFADDKLCTLRNHAKNDIGFYPISIILAIEGTPSAFHTNNR